MTNKWRPKNPYTEKVGEAWSDVLQAMRWTVFEEGVNAMMEAIEKIGGKMTNKWRPEGKKKGDCSQCKGTGIEERPYSLIGKTVMLPYICPRCEGIGKVALA